MTYKHTQIGHLIIFVLLTLSILFCGILTQADFDFGILVLMAFILLLTASFASLTVEIDDTYLRIAFGYGVFRKRFKLSEIVSAKVVKNHWLVGWGIRLWLWPRTWIFNVSGFDAVEIKMQNGKLYRIGTDEPKKLEQAIAQVIKQ
jgi:hypothetical protein